MKKLVNIFNLSGVSDVKCILCNRIVDQCHLEYKRGKGPKS